MPILLFFAGFLVFLIFLLMGITSVFKKNGRAKKNFIIMTAGLVSMIIGISIAVSTQETSKTASSQTSETQSDTATHSEKVNEDSESKAKKEKEEKAKAEEESKKAAEEKAKKEAEEKAAAEAKKKEKTIEANGTFIVNDEIKPGIYRAEEGIIYWARLSGFSGELDQILANGTPFGSAIVEIKTTDKGFQTSGSSEWTLIDESYKPEVKKEFGDGTYIVGKDIEPGTYKSDESVLYWARLNNFTGSLDSIIANNIPTGAEIVEIKATDKGFVTNGGGTWKKID